MARDCKAAHGAVGYPTAIHSGGYAPTRTGISVIAIPGRPYSDAVVIYRGTVHLAVDASWQTGVSEHENGFLSGRRGEGIATAPGGAVTTTLYDSQGDVAEVTDPTASRRRTPTTAVWLRRHRMDDLFTSAGSARARGTGQALRRRTSAASAAAACPASLDSSQRGQSTFDQALSWLKMSPAAGCGS